MALWRAPWKPQTTATKLCQLLELRVNEVKTLLPFRQMHRSISAGSIQQQFLVEQQRGSKKEHQSMLTIIFLKRDGLSLQERSASVACSKGSNQTHSLINLSTGSAIVSRSAWHGLRSTSALMSVLEGK